MTPAPTAPARAVFRVPIERNPNFAGRQRVLGDLHRGFTARGLSSTGPRVRVICGSGGVGKTNLAAEYAYRHADEYEIVWWLRSEEPATLVAGYVALAEALRLRTEEASTVDTLCDDVRRALDKREGWLLIFDNARAAEHLTRFMPKRSAGHVLVTTRNAQWQGNATSTLLAGLERPESLELLARSTGKDADPAAGDLARALGDLPLALEQASACIREAGLSFADYLQNLEGQWGEFLARRKTQGEYPDSVALSGELSLRQVKATAPAAADLLSLCAFLSPDEIALSLLRCGGVFADEPLKATLSDASQLDAAASLLARFNLARFDGKNLSLHRLVRALSRDRLDAGPRLAFANAALQLAASAFEFDGDDAREDAQAWKRCGPVLPHALAAAGAAEEMGIDKPATARLLDDAGQYLLRSAQYAQAKPLFQRALLLQREAYGDAHPKVAAVSNNLARVLTQLGELDEARQHFEYALSVDQAAYGAADPHVATVANNYARCLHASGHMREARQQFERALGSYQSHYGAEHFKVAGVVNNLGYVMRSEGHEDQGLENFQRAMSMAEASCGPDDPSVARIACNLGEVHRRRGSPQAARELFERALKIDRDYYGPNHPDVMHDLRHLGDAQMDLGDLGGARESYKQALFIADATCAHKPRAIADCLRRLGRARNAQGDTDGAARCLELAAGLLRKQRAQNQLAANNRAAEGGITTQVRRQVGGVRAHA